jgi:hypothetical protein
MRFTTIYNDAMPEAAHAERSRSSRRRLFRLGVFLLLGAVINFAVAWNLSMYGAARPQGRFDAESTWTSAWTMQGKSDGLPFRVVHRTWGAEATSIIWPGFAINTIFYAAMLWMLWIAPGKIRRFIRVKRHRCPACGYQIDSAPGIGPVCSECGAALPAAWRTSASP